MAISDEEAGMESAPTILIVEDEAMIRLALLEYLKDSGFTTLQAANAGEAMRTIERNGGRIDLVFTDIRMPGDMDGIGLAQWVHDELPSIPVILASGYSSGEEAARAAGEDFLSKPYKLDQLAEKIRTAIAARRDQ